MSWESGFEVCGFYNKDPVIVPNIRGILWPACIPTIPRPSRSFLLSPHKGFGVQGSGPLTGPIFRTPHTAAPTDMESDVILIQYLEGQGNLVGRLITPITHKVTLAVPMINSLTKFP